MRTIKCFEKNLEAANTAIVRDTFGNQASISAILNIWESRTTGKTDREFDKLMRRTMGKKIWSHMTQEERFIEFRASILDDLWISLNEIREGNRVVVEYFLDRALDPLDPFAGVYQAFLRELGAEILYEEKVFKGIRFPKGAEKQTIVL